MENLFIEHFLSYEDFRSNKEIQALERQKEDYIRAIYKIRRRYSMLRRI